MAILPPTAANIERARAQLTAGGLVAMPTETVYGLAARAVDSDAVAAIYATKQRPQFNPLICHVADLAMAQAHGVFNPTAQKLAQHFWPGALTLVVPRRADTPICTLVSAGLYTLALRMPSHQVAQQLIAACDSPLAAPSANPSGRLSPTRADHVAAMLPEIDVLEGGACEIGLESTIIGCFDTAPLLLREGGIARHDIEAVLGEKLQELPEHGEATAKRAPGRLARHYAPRAGLRLNQSAEAAQRDDCLLIGFGADAPDTAAANLSPTGDLVEAASQLFNVLHRLDDQAMRQGQSLAIMPIPEQGLGAAINDRLRRAAEPA